MRFLDLYIKGFGKFHDTFVSFEDGLNLVYGKNEAGKSTIHTFIRGMLFGIERGGRQKTIFTANMSPGKTAPPMRDSCVWNPAALFTGSSGVSRKIRRSLSLSMKLQAGKQSLQRLC